MDYKGLCLKMMTDGANLQTYAGNGAGFISHANMCSSRSLKEGHTSELGCLWKLLVSVYHSYVKAEQQINKMEKNLLSTTVPGVPSAQYSLIHVAQIRDGFLAGLHLQNCREMSRHHFCLLWSSNAL